MNKNIYHLFFILLLFSAAFLTAQESRFMGPVDLSSTVQEFSTGLKSDTNVTHLIEGTVVGWSQNDQNPDTIDVQILNAEWQGYETIQPYLALVQFKKAEWSVVFPLERQRNIDPKTVAVNERIFLAVKFKEIANVDGDRRPLFQGLFVRKLR